MADSLTRFVLGAVRIVCLVLSVLLALGVSLTDYCFESLCSNDHPSSVEIRRVIVSCDV